MKKILYTNYDLGERMEAERAFLEAEFPHDTFTDDKVLSMVEEDLTDDFNALYDALREHFSVAPMIVCFGQVESWTGKREAAAMFKTFEKAWDAITKDCDYIEVVDDRGHLTITASHHDGTNVMEVKIVSTKGTVFYDHWRSSTSKKYDYSEYDCLMRIVRNNTLSSLPHVYDTMCW